MILAEFETLLKETSGLDAASIGSSAIERAVRERLTACHLKDPDAYWERVRTSEIEMQELIEAVVVPETWFFRDREAFNALGRRAVQEWLPTHPAGQLRLLSLPCSTGEEAYSMAIALLDAGFPGRRFSIDALDISTRALALAGRAVYGKNSFRGKELGFRDRYFEATSSGYRLTEAVRRPVRFQPGNVFDSDLLPGAEIYDVIFCRNMLIYFDRVTQDRTIAVLQRLLEANGVLFVGPAETGLMLDHNFASTKEPMAFAFRKKHAVPRETKKVRALPPVHQSPPAKGPAPIPRPASMTPPPPPGVNLDEAVELANQGRLAEAAKLCEEFLRTHGAAPQAYHLLGLVRDAAGLHAEAAGFYRKALYLNPGHRDALLHLALLLEKQGDKVEAKLLHDRLRRLEHPRAA